MDTETKGFAEAKAFLETHQRDLGHAFDYAFRTNANILGIVSAAKDKGMERVEDNMRKVTRQFYDAGILSALAIQLAERDIEKTLDTILAAAPVEVREALGRLIGKVTP